MRWLRVSGCGIGWSRIGRCGIGWSRIRIGGCRLRRCWVVARFGWIRGSGRLCRDSGEISGGRLERPGRRRGRLALIVWMVGIYPNRFTMFTTVCVSVEFIVTALTEKLLRA